MKIDRHNRHMRRRVISAALSMSLIVIAYQHTAVAASRDYVSCSSNTI